MKSLININIGVALLATLLSHSSFAQSQGAGNGGGSIVQANADGSLNWAKSLDLYEGALLLNYKYINVTDYETQVRTTLATAKILQRDFANAALAEAEKIMASIHYQNQSPAPYVKLINVPLEKTTDVLNFAVPVDCIRCSSQQAAVRLTAQQSAAYSGIQYSFQKQIWDAFDPLDKTALVLHEAIYKTLNTQNSLAIRRIVRELLNATPFDFVNLTDALSAAGYQQTIPTIGERPNLKAGEIQKLNDQQISINLVYSLPYNDSIETVLNLKLIYDQNGKIDRAATSEINRSSSQYSFAFENCEDQFLKNRKNVVTGTLIRNGIRTEFTKRGYSAIGCRGVNHFISANLNLFEDIQIDLQFKDTSRWVSALMVNRYPITIPRMSGIVFSGPFVRLVAPDLKID